MHFKNSLNQFSQNDLQTLNALKFIQQSQQQNTQPPFYPQHQSQHLSNYSSNGVMSQASRQILGLNQLLQPDCNSNHLKNWQNIAMGNNNNNNININDTHLDRAARFHRSSAALCKLRSFLFLVHSRMKMKWRYKTKKISFFSSYRWCHMYLEWIFATTCSQSGQLFAKSFFRRHSMGHQWTIIDTDFQTIWTNQVNKNAN